MIQDVQAGNVHDVGETGKIQSDCNRIQGEPERIPGAQGVHRKQTVSVQGVYWTLSRTKSKVMK